MGRQGGAWMGKTVRTKLDCFFRKVEPGGVG